MTRERPTSRERVTVPWVRRTYPSGSILVLADYGERVTAWLRERGLRVPTPNRLSNAAATVRRLDPATSHNLPMPAEDHAALREALRTLLDAALIFWTATHPAYRRAVDPFPTNRLAFLLQGRDAAAGEQRTEPRDIQFELVAGATLVLSGLDAFPDEPDYCTSYFGERIGIAAKRLSSVKRGTVSRRLRKARDQFEENNLRGFAFISVDPLVMSLAGSTLEQIGSDFHRRVARVHDALDDDSKDPRLLGAFLVGASVESEGSPDERKLVFRRTLQFYSFTEPTEEKLSGVLQFVSGMQARYFNGTALFAKSLLQR